MIDPKSELLVPPLAVLWLVLLGVDHLTGWAPGIATVAYPCLGTLIVIGAYLGRARRFGWPPLEWLILHGFTVAALSAAAWGARILFPSR